MSSSSSAPKARLDASSVEPLGHSVRDLAASRGVSAAALRCRMLRRTLAYVQIGRLGTRVLVLLGDQPVLDGVAPEPGSDGRETVARAFPGRTTLRLGEVATALGVGRRTVERLLRAGELDCVTDEHGRRLVEVAAFRKWILAHRVATRWEIEGAGR